MASTSKIDQFGQIFCVSKMTNEANASGELLIIGLHLHHDNVND